MIPVLGDWVVDQYGRTGRVTAIHFACPESPSWIRGQAIPVTEAQRDGRWVSVLVHGGGAVVQPIDTLTVTEPPGVIDNLWADVYFRMETA